MERALFHTVEQAAESREPSVDKEVQKEQKCEYRDVEDSCRPKIAGVHRANEGPQLLKSSAQELQQKGRYVVLKVEEVPCPTRA